MLLNNMHKDWDDGDNDVRDGIVTLCTCGGGYWTDNAKAVRVTELRLIANSKESGELCVHFNTDDWRVDKMGLIYTDPLFMQELQAYLTARGYVGKDVSYSEQGLQGDNYVSCDAGAAFIASYMQQHADFVIV